MRSGEMRAQSDRMETLRVLVVEDYALIAMLLSELLASMGHDVCATAASEAEAVLPPLATPRT